MKKVDIIIPTKDNPEDLFICLSSINDSIDKKNYKVDVIIVDDHSSKSNREKMYNKFIKYNIYKNISIFIIPMNKTYGFTKSLNIGLKHSFSKKIHADYIGVLHDDVKIFKGWIEDLENILETDFSIAGVGSVNLNNLEIQSLQKIKGFKYDASWESYDQDSEGLSEIIKNTYDENDIEEKNISFFASLFKFETLKKIKKFDENIVNSIDIENDLQNKIKNMDKRTVLVKKSYVYHKCRLKILENLDFRIYNLMKKASDLNYEIKRSLNIRKYNIVYTFCGNNEFLPHITNFDQGYEYVCFTNNEQLYSLRERVAIWKIFWVGDILDSLSIHKFSQKGKLFFKFHPHLFFNDKFKSIWIDSSIINDFKTSKYSDITSLSNGDNFLMCPNSSKYNSAYELLIDMYENGEMTNNEYDSVLQLYRWFHLPNDMGMIDSNVMILKQDDERCILAMNKIWNYIDKYYANDRLFMNLILWVNKFSYSYIPNKLFYEYFFKLKEN